MTSLTKQKTQPQNTLMVYYQGFVAVAAVLVFFSGFDKYLSKGIGVGNSLLCLIGFLFISIPIFTSILKRLNYIPISIVIWCVFYLALPFISVLLLPNIVLDMQNMEDRIRTIILLLLMLVIFSQHLLVLRWTKLAIVFVTLSHWCMLIYEFFNPLAFYLEQDSAGRSAAFYGDSNEAGCGLVLGMILTMDLIKPKYRLFYALFLFLGIIVTFSRGAIVGWLLVILVFMATKVIPRYQISLFVLSAFVSLSILSSQLNNLSYIKTADGTELFNESTISRLEFLINPLGQEDDSSDSRKGHVEEAWGKFYKQPFIGHGLGAGASDTHRNSEGEGQRSHNTYLDQMVEFGFLGALIYPGLLLASVWKAQGELKKYALAFVLFLLAWGFFSHTIMNSPFSLISYAIMANFTKQSRLGNL